MGEKMDCCKTKDKDGCCKDTKLKGGKNYGIVVSADGYLFQSLNLDIPPDKDRMKLPPIVLKKIEVGKIEVGGILADVAPTILELMESPQPPEMTGKSLLKILAEK